MSPRTWPLLSLALVALLLASPMSVVLAMQVTAEQSLTCEDSALTWSGFRSCLSDELDKSLQQEYELTAAYVLARDAQAGALLEAAQQEWQRYWRASCSYAEAARQTQVGAEDANFECYAAFVNARIKILRSYRSSFGKSD